MLAFALIFALTAHSALAKPTGNCIFMCEAQPGASSGAYTQPGFGGSSGAYTQPGFGGSSGAYTQPGFGGSSGTYSQPGFAGSSGVYTQPGFVGSSGAYTQPGFGSVGTGFGKAPPSFAYPSRSGRLDDFGSAAVYPEVVQQQIPVQPEIKGLFTHSSSKSSYEANNAFLQIHQPGASKTVISEPIRQPRPTRICQDYYDPCY